MSLDLHFWPGRKVLLTGHTGFKGAWLSLWLHKLGSRVSGFSLPPGTTPSLYELLGGEHLDKEVIGDIRDEGLVKKAVEDSDPEIVIHMAAQALVHPGYADPVGTFSTNMMGTVHLLDALRGAKNLRLVLVVTSDKVYRNENLTRHFSESDALGGSDPYSASKSCQDIIAQSYRQSYYTEPGVSVATARAGNVIGGGDWAEYRLLTDVEAGVSESKPIEIRNPQATRPWQHVLDPLAGYMMYAQALWRDGQFPSALNFGPEGSATVETVVSRYLKARDGRKTWNKDHALHPRESRTLEIDPGNARKMLNWRAILDLDSTVQWTADWHNALGRGIPAQEISLKQISDYEDLMKGMA